MTSPAQNPAPPCDAPAAERISVHTVQMVYNNAHSGVWFSPGTIRYFSSRFMEEAYRVGSKTDATYFFVSSEQDRHSRFYRPRRYTVRVMTYAPDSQHWTMDAIGGFDYYKSRNGAMSALRRVVAEFAALPPENRQAWLEENRG